MAPHSLAEASALSAARSPYPGMTWDPLPEPEQVDVNGTLLWYPAPDVTVRARRIFGDRWEVLTVAGSGTRVQMVLRDDVASVVRAAYA